FGRVVWGDQILLILARHLLRELPGATIIADVKASQVLFDGIAAAGGTPLMWKTGHSLIKTKMAETGAPLAGEMSGHIFFRHRFYGHDDALYAALRLLEAIAAQGGDLAGLRNGLPRIVNTPELRFPCPEERKVPVIEAVRERLAAAGAEVIAVDGVRVIEPEGWWLLRASNTQDVLVARVEAVDAPGLERLKGSLREALAGTGITPPADL
ncbi:MAG: phosphomannomutase, partial [Alphaproteobacteria bacterium]